MDDNFRRICIKSPQHAALNQLRRENTTMWSADSKTNQRLMLGDRKNQSSLSVSPLFSSVDRTSFHCEEELWEFPPFGYSNIRIFEKHFRQKVFRKRDKEVAILWNHFWLQRHRRWKKNLFGHSKVLCNLPFQEGLRFIQEDRRTFCQEAVKHSKQMSSSWINNRWPQDFLLQFCFPREFHRE